MRGIRSSGSWQAVCGVLICACACACDGEVLPTRAEEQLRLASALSSTLAASLATLPGVADARVHLALPLAADFAPDFAPELAPQPRASVLLHARSGHAPIDIAAVQTLVAGAVPELAASAVHVVVASTPAALAAPAPRLTQLGPFVVAESSEGGLRALIASLLVTQLVLAGILCFVIARQRQRLAASAQPGS